MNKRIAIVLILVAIAGIIIFFVAKYLNMSGFSIFVLEVGGAWIVSQLTFKWVQGD